MRVFLFLFLAACGSARFDQHLNDAKGRWAAAKIQSYELTYKGTGSTQQDSTRITVNDNVVVAAEMAGAPVATSGQPTVDVLFERIRTGARGNNTNASYDEKLGYPHSAHFDDGGEGSGFSVINFKAL